TSSTGTPRACASAAVVTAWAEDGSPYTRRERPARSSAITRPRCGSPASSVVTPQRSHSLLAISYQPQPSPPAPRPVRGRGETADPLRGYPPSPREGEGAGGAGLGGEFTTF